MLNTWSDFNRHDSIRVSFKQISELTSFWQDIFKVGYLKIQSDDILKRAISFFHLGITEKLEHLQDIGVTGVWLSPIFKSPMADFGYDISDFRTIDPLFGSMEDLEELLRKAKSLGKWQINPLKTKRRPLYLKTQFVPRTKHFSSRL